MVNIRGTRASKGRRYITKEALSSCPDRGQWFTWTLTPFPPGLDLSLVHNHSATVLPDRDNLFQDRSLDGVLRAITVSAQPIQIKVTELGPYRCLENLGQLLKRTANSLDREKVPDDGFDHIPGDEDEDVVVLDVL